MKMYTETNFCRLCLNKKIKVELKLKNIPLGEKYSKVKSIAKNSFRFPLNLGWCEKCRTLQTMEIISPRLLWSDFTYLSSQTKAIVDHFKILSGNIIKKFKVKKNHLIIDIGSNDGTFLRFFKDKKCRVLGVDPAKNVVRIAKNNGINTIPEFFDLKIAKKISKKNKKAKIVTCFNTFAHAPNMREIIKGIKEILADDGIFIFECQYLSDIYKKKILGTIFHEHMYHHSVTSLDNFFRSFGLDLFDVKKVNIQKGSIIGFVCKKNKKSISKSVKNLLKLERLSGDIELKKLVDLKKFINLQKTKASKILKPYKGKIIGAFGSARSGPTLAFNYGLDKSFGMFFDDHPLKVGKYSYFNGLRVLPTKQISTINPAILIILAYLHSKKIVKKNIKYLKNGGKFLAVYPKVSLITFKNYKKFI